MYAVIVKVRVKPGHQQDFLNAMLENATCAAGNEPGCLQFNVAQDSQDQNLLHLYEVYRDLDAFEAHKKTPHFLKCMEAGKDWLDGPLEFATGTHVFP